MTFIPTVGTNHHMKKHWIHFIEEYTSLCQVELSHLEKTSKYNELGYTMLISKGLSFIRLSTSLYHLFQLCDVIQNRHWDFVKSCGILNIVAT